jgi:hypothetical protein
MRLTERTRYDRALSISEPLEVKGFETGRASWQSCEPRARAFRKFLFFLHLSRGERI